MALYDIADAIAKVSELLKRSIDLFDPDPERKRLNALARAKEDIAKREVFLKKAIDRAKKLSALSLIFVISGCVRYLPHDAAEYKRQLDECKETNSMLVDSINDYMQSVDALRDNCR